MSDVYITVTDNVVTAIEVDKQGPSGATGETGPIGETGATGAQGVSGDAYLDGGVADSIYGAIEPIDGGNATSF